MSEHHTNCFRATCICRPIGARWKPDCWKAATCLNRAARAFPNAP